MVWQWSGAALVTQNIRIRRSSTHCSVLWLIPILLYTVLDRLSYEPKFSSNLTSQNPIISKGTIRFTARPHDSIVAHLYMTVQVKYNESSQCFELHNMQLLQVNKTNDYRACTDESRTQNFLGMLQFASCMPMSDFSILLSIALYCSHVGSLSVFQSFMSTMIRNKLSINAILECRCLVWCLFCHSQWATTIPWMPLCNILSCS